MEWLKKLLEGKVAEGEIEAVLTGIQKELPAHFIPKYKFDEVNNEKKALEKTVVERDQQIVDLGKVKGDSEELKQKLEALQTANAEAKAAHEATIKDIRLNNALEKSLSDAKAKYPDLVSAKVDKTKLQLQEDGKIIGLDDQIKVIKETYKDLFVEETKQTTTPSFKGFVPEEGAGGQGGTPSVGAFFAQKANGTQSTQGTPAQKPAVVNPWSV